METNQNAPQEEADLAPAESREARDLATRWGGGGHLRQSIKEDGFLGVPTVYLKNISSLSEYGITPTEALFILHIMSFKWGKDMPYPSYQRLADRMGQSVVYARKLAKSIESKGLMKRIVKKGTTNKFDLSPMFKMLDERSKEATESKNRRASVPTF